MLAKILFTAAVILGVIVFFRHRRAPVAAATDASAGRSGGRSIPPRALAYSLLGVLAAVAVLLYALDKRQGARVVTIRVIAGGEATDYRARRDAIDGRSFVTTDGVRVTPAAADRIEMLAP